MIDGKHQKTFWIVVLGVCSVSLVAALIAAFASSLNMMINLKKIFLYGPGMPYSDSNTLLSGGLVMGLVVIGALFIVLCIVLKGKIKTCSLVMSIITAVYSVAASVTAYVVISRSNVGKSYFNYYSYTVFETVLSAVLSIAVPVILSTVSLFVLSKLNAKEREPDVQAEV